MTSRAHLRSRDLDNDTCRALVSALKEPIGRFHDTHDNAESAVVKVPLWWEGIIERGIHASVRVEQPEMPLESLRIMGHEIELADVEKPVVVGGDGDE